MPAPTPSKLDSTHILPAIYDDDTGRIRVSTDLGATIVNGHQQIDISDTDDSIKIGDGNGNYAEVVDGQVKVITPSISQFETSQHNIATTAVKITSVVNKKKTIVKATQASPTIYIGKDATVTSSTGYPLSIGETFILDGSQDVYAICASSSQTVYVAELS